MQSKKLFTKSRPAFTIIEILISVIILSGSILFVLKLHGQNQDQISYVTERNKLSLQDSLFLTNNALRHHKDTKNAYDILGKYFKVNESKSREILKNCSRAYFIPESLMVIPPEETNGPSATVDEIKIKDKWSSSFYRFKISSF
jgi:type II secretory pathway pseudopilin PulG